MKRALHLLVTRVLRSRAGVALALAVLVLVVVAAARALSGPGDTATAHLPVPPLVASGSQPHEDGLLSPAATASPTPIPGAETPEEVARAFAADWLARGASAADWHSRLARRATPELARKLSGVDPATVPANRITGDPAVIAHAATIVDVIVPVDSGELRLHLVATSDRWLVDGVDWERA
jgi:hypothetical protein